MVDRQTAESEVMGLNQFVRVHVILEISVYHSILVSRSEIKSIHNMEWN